MTHSFPTRRSADLAYALGHKSRRSRADAVGGNHGRELPVAADQLAACDPQLRGAGRTRLAVWRAAVAELPAVAAGSEQMRTSRTATARDGLDRKSTRLNSSQ